MTNKQDVSMKSWADPSVTQLWVEPEIRALSVQETFAFPNLGADVGGNAFPDCQQS